MEEAKIKQEHTESSLEAGGRFKESWKKKSLEEQFTRSLQTVHSNSNLSTGAKEQIEASILFAHSSRGSTAGQLEKKITANYTLGTRCGEIFVALNAKQWTFVCTFCNKSTRDIGDFICHIKIKHLQESDVIEHPYQNEYCDDTATSDQEARIQSQDYLDCSNYLDINVHTDVEDLMDSNEKYGNRFNDRLSCESKWSRPYQENQFAARRQLQRNVVKILEDCDNDIEDLLEAHTSHRGQTDTTTLRQQQSIQNQSRTVKIKQKYNGNYREESNYNAASNDINESLVDYTHNENDYDRDEYDSNENDNNEDFDDDFDNQLLLPSTDSTKSSSLSNDGKIKRRQIRGTAYCALCNRTFQYYSLYRNHMIKHSNETPFKCPLCKKGFKSKQAIRYHMNTHQKEKQFKCAICDASFYTENQFITHILTHENATTYPCMVCGKVLRSEKDRDLHLTTHTEERPFRCEFCQKLFRLRHHLSNHLKLHRQYRCDYCKEEFTSAVHLRKPYACEVCENSPEVRAGNINPLQLFDAVVPPIQPTECVDLAEMVSDSDEIEEKDELEDDNNFIESNPSQQTSSSNIFYDSQSAKKTKPFPCKKCPRAYSHLSGLNYHSRMKH